MLHVIKARWSGILLIGAMLAVFAVTFAPSAARAQSSTCKVTTSAPTYVTNSIGALSCETDGDLRVAATVTPPALQNVNLTQVGSAAVALGSAVSASSIPVVIASDQGAVPVSFAPSAVAGVGITPVVSSALETGHVLKASAGNLYSLNVTTTSVGGYVMTFNSATVPAAGTVAPIHCVPVAANSSVSISYGSGPPAVFSTGISAAFSTNASCFTKTDSATAFFNGAVK